MCELEGLGPQCHQSRAGTGPVWGLEKLLPLVASPVQGGQCNSTRAASLLGRAARGCRDSCRGEDEQSPFVVFPLQAGTFVSPLDFWGVPPPHGAPARLALAQGWWHPGTRSPFGAVPSIWWLLPTEAKSCWPWGECVGAAHPKFHSVGWAAGSQVLSSSPPQPSLGTSPLPKSRRSGSALLCPSQPCPLLAVLGEEDEFQGGGGERKRTAAWGKEKGQQGETQSPEEDGEGAGRREKRRDLRVVLVPVLALLPSRMLRQQAWSGTEPGWVRGCWGGSAVGGGDTETRSSVHRGP